MSSQTDRDALPATDWKGEAMKRRMAKRQAAERRFRLTALGAALAGIAALAALAISIFGSAAPALYTYETRLAVTFEEDAFAGIGALSEEERQAALSAVDYGALLRQALMARFPEAQGRRDVRDLQALVSAGARSMLRDVVAADFALVGSTSTLWVPAGPDAQQFLKSGRQAAVRLSDRQAGWLADLQAAGETRRVFNAGFLTSGDSREPELAGIEGAMVGSLLTLLVTLAAAFPLGVAAAVYLEEFAKKTRLSHFLELNINNLAAVPSIVFGLLGLAVFLNVMHLPRSAPIVGGLTLALMTLPTVIIASRASLKAVPPSIRDAAIGLGASPVQVTWHHVVPNALPGILTGAIIGMARALGETAPLLMIGMVAFVVDTPGGIFDAATVLPVQIYLWADSPERGFVEKTSAAIVVLLVFLVAMNALAVYLRKKFERRW